ncbi:GntR family transcriptional regulator [Sulfitobacter sp. KE34]|nr:GntR family transcriptional regulator [Sulfitobacter sp. KE12]MDF3354916.1 GntR family transcriptional regulator [Sulfitobacter sp. KE27]MDF3358564.1 GntR family transcriptional regulator [Sulfitobacter sp. KE33]MDF3362379.1 GntR family transcriptional regulator [Sulfitobacter sp. Ks41]MDF3365988.1 GntR family transcriptional regulator [Sulfitobacter sp. Ks34]MDF3369597.1 GntR family transcriptional regulator [Sulfitobacter sp. Ks43]MDF3373246.1 GntR family transcriptional regulator [Sulfi
MSDKQAKFERAMDRIVQAMDRSSSVSLSVQLRGALEFGIASGELPSDARLPSVRALAARMKISPVTVSNVYAALQSSGLVEGRVGSGTFVSGGGSRAHDGRFRQLDQQIAELLSLAKSCGVSASELAVRISMASSASPRPLRILMVGNFIDATRAYADELRQHLPEGDEIDAAVLDEISPNPPKDIDLIIAPKTLLSKTREILPNVEVLGLTLIPNEATRVALASIPPDAKTLAYSYFPGFVTIMKAGILRFAPHVTQLTMKVRDENGLSSAMREADVVIYATGADYLRGALRPEQTAFEYRHTPDVHAIRSEILPAIETCRASLKSAKAAEE